MNSPFASAPWALVLCLLAGAAPVRAQQGPQLTKPPKLLQFVEPTYPEAAREGGVEATVTLALDLDEAGQVVAATPVGDPQPGFDEAAVEAALGLLFEPAQVDGVAAPVRIGFRFRFALQQEEVPPERLTLTGVVVSRKSGAPLAQVEVALQGQEQVAQTDDVGAFAFEDLLPGVYVLQLSAQGHLTTAVEHALEPGAPPLEVTLEARQKRSAFNEELVIRVPRVRKEVGAASMSASEARSIPGVMGDALAVVQNLPGVARASAGSGEVVVWGSAPAETRIYVDDVPIPYLYHRGGLRSVVNDSLVSSVELVPGGFGASYGRAIGGIVRVQTSPVPKEGLGGYLGADVIDASAGVSHRQKVEQGPHAVAAAGRVGYLQHLLPRVVPDVQGAISLPAYWDYVSKWIRRGEGGGTLQLLAFGAADEVDRLLTGAGTDVAQGERAVTQFHRLALTYERPQAGGTVKALVWGGFDRADLGANFGEVATSQRMRGYRAGARLAQRQPLSEQVSLLLGADAELGRYEYQRAGTVSLPAREGDRALFGQSPGDRVAFDRWTAHLGSAATFAELELRPWDGLTVTPGVRFEPSLVEGNRLLPTGTGVDVGFSRLELFFDPRLSAELRLTEQLSLNGAVGLYHQGPDPADLSAVFGGPGLGSASGRHAVLGATVRPWVGASLEVAAFAKDATQLAARSPLETPPLAQGLLSTGEGRSYGAQVVVRPGEWNKLTGWVSYSLMRAERRDAPERAWRLFDFDQTHVMVAVASYEPWPGWKLGARLRGTTGYPRTPVTGALYDAKSDSFQPVRGESNADRLPAFVQLDVRAERVGKMAGLGWSVYLDVLNVTNRANPEEVVYSFDYADRQYLTGLPLLAVLGGRLEFH
jgi:TonB family protein